MIVPGDGATTAANILANQTLFRMGICSLILVIILDLVAAWALYVFLKPVNRSISLLAAWFRVVFLTIFGTALAFLFIALTLLSGADYVAGFETDQIYAQVMLCINGFHVGENIAYIFFSLHLLVLGYLVYKLDPRSTIPKILGALLTVAGFGYLIDSAGELLLPGYGMNVAMFTFIGEVLFMVWLLVKGGKVSTAG